MYIPLSSFSVRVLLRGSVSAAWEGYSTWERMQTAKLDKKTCILNKTIKHLLDKLHHYRL